MEFWRKSKNIQEKQKSQESKEVDLLLTPEMEVDRESKPDFDSIYSSADFLDAIDFDTLNQIFDSLIAKSGGVENTNTSGHKINREQVTFQNSLGSEEEELINGVAYVDSGDIKLAWADELETPLSTDDILALLATFVHEGTHVRGGFSEKHDASLLTRLLLRRNKSTTRIGYQDSSFDHSLLFGPLSVDSGVSLNEAVTENIAHDVLKEYLLRTGKSGYLQDAEALESLEPGTYCYDRLVLGVVIDALSDELGIHRDDIWRGFGRGYMSGDIEVQSLFSDISHTLSSNPEVGRLVPLLASEERLKKSSEINRESILSHVGNNEKELRSKQLSRQAEVYRLVNRSFNHENLINVLHLR